MTISLQARVSGRLRVQLLTAEGEVRVDSGWFKNLITNQGLDWFGSFAYTTYNGNGYATLPGMCTVGTGNTTPSFTDTALVAPLGISNAWLNPPGTTSPQYSQSYVVGPPDYISAVGTHTFTLGSIVGNIAEIGLGVQATTGATTLSLFSRALIVDGGGSPTTIAVTSADQLVVTYELRMYLDLTDTAYSVTISGTGYSGVVRRAKSTTSNATVVVPIDNPNPGLVGYSSPSITFYNGTIGAVTSIPSGTASSTYSNAPQPSYTSGTYTKSYTFSFATGDANISGGISAFIFQIATFGYWQFSVSPAISKDATKTMTLQIAVSWARYP